MRKIFPNIPAIFLIILAAIVFSGLHGVYGSRPDGSPSWATVENALSVQGHQLPDGVFMTSLPRDDVRVTVGDVTLEPAMVMDSWVAFARMGNETMMMGDLVLTADELFPVQDRLLRGGLDITAIHNTLAGETPQVFDVHVSGRGGAAQMAGVVRDALVSANVRHSSSIKGDHSRLPYLLDAGQIDPIIGAQGTIENGIVQYRVPRREKITENGMEIPPSFDVASVLKFQPLPDHSAAVMGEFVLLADEVRPVFRALNGNGIEVTATHTHMLTEEPRLFYLHVWAVGDPEKLARGLRDALEQTNSTISH